MIWNKNILEMHRDYTQPLDFYVSIHIIQKFTGAFLTLATVPGYSSDH